MEFKSAKELLTLCKEHDMPISAVMRTRECTLGETDEAGVDARMARAWDIMRTSAHEPLTTPLRSMGGLIGGESRKLNEHCAASRSILGPVLARATAYAMAVLEVNASMGLIVAAPTAGSAGVVPGVLLALQEERGFSDETMIRTLFNAGAVGYLAMRNATVERGGRLSGRGGRGGGHGGLGSGGTAGRHAGAVP